MVADREMCLFMRLLLPQEALSISISVPALPSSCEGASKRTGLQPYLIPSKVNLTMHSPHGGFTGISSILLRLSN